MMKLIKLLLNRNLILSFKRDKSLCLSLKTSRKRMSMRTEKSSPFMNQIEMILTRTKTGSMEFIKGNSRRTKMLDSDFDNPLLSKMTKSTERLDHMFKQ